MLGTDKSSLNMSFKCPFLSDTFANTYKVKVFLGTTNPLHRIHNKNSNLNILHYGDSVSVPNALLRYPT